MPTASSSPQQNPQHNLRLTIAYEPIEAIHPNPRDARIYGAAEQKRVSRAVKAFGAMPLIVNAERQMLSGNVWLQAARLAGITSVPVIVADHLSPAEADAFMIAQVRLIENGAWDDQKLGAVLKDLTCANIDFDITLTGFEVGEIDLKIAGLDAPNDADDAADAIPEPGPAVSQMGDLWIMGPHRLLCGDALVEESYVTVMGDEEAQIVVTDPPYNIAIENNVSGLGAVKHLNFAMGVGEMDSHQFTQFLLTTTTLAAMFSARGALGYWWMGWQGLSSMLAAGDGAYGELINICTWGKTNPGMGGLYRSATEFAVIFKKKGAAHRNNVRLGRFGRNRSNLWLSPGANVFARGGEEGNLLALHPTVKPVGLLTDILLDASARGDVVLDPFVGSGSILIAADKVGRCARGIEISPAYVDVAVQRWQRWSGEVARLAVTGRTFAEVAAERQAQFEDGEGGDER